MKADKLNTKFVVFALLLSVFLPGLLSARAYAALAAPAQEAELAYKVYLPSLAKSSGAVPLPTSTSQATQPPAQTATATATGQGSSHTSTPTATQSAPTRTPTPTATSPVPSQTPTPTRTPTEPPPPEGGALFLNTTNKTNSASSAVDAAGGMHFAYSAYGNDTTGHSPAYYAYCASGCSSDANWGIVTLGDQVQEVQLLLTSTGHPRLLLAADNANYDRIYIYAACDTACTDPANWAQTTVTVSTYINVLSWDRPQHYFALDPQDRPRFLYRKSIGSGIYYVFCDLNCTSDTTWWEFELTPDTLYDPTLVFTRAGQPRILTDMYPGNTSDGVLYYLACDSDCTNPASWTFTPLMTTGGGVFVMRLDSNDRPRAALSARPSVGDPMILYYLWCDTGCANDANWSAYDIGFAPGQAEEPDLALDASGHPRISFKDNTNDGMGYAWCDAGCETFSPTWQAVVAEPSGDLDAEWEILPPYNCSDSYWYGGYRSSLSLDASGNPRIGYDASHLHGGGCTVGEDFRTVRFLFFNQP